MEEQLDAISTLCVLTGQFFGWLPLAAQQLLTAGGWGLLPELSATGEGPVQALVLGLQGARERRSGQLGEAITLLDAALGQPGLPDSLRRFLLLHRANALRVAGRYADGAADYQQLWQTPGEFRDNAGYWLADYRFLQGQFSRALSDLDQLPPGSAELRGEVVRLQGHVHRVNALFDQAEARYRQALDLARDSANAAAEGKALTDLLQTLSWFRPAEALDLQPRALDTNQAVRNQVEIVKIHAATAVAMGNLGNPGNASTEIQAGLELTELDTRRARVVPGRPRPDPDPARRHPGSPPDGGQPRRHCRRAAGQPVLERDRELVDPPRRHGHPASHHQLARRNPRRPSQVDGRPDISRHGIVSHMTEARQKILIVGLGDVAATHLKVIEQTPDAEVVAGADIEPKTGLTFRGRPLPVYRSPGEAAGHHQIDVVVIATPTPSHAAVCAAVARCFPAARILVEKPAASNLADAHHVLRDIGGRQPVDVAYHMAFAPEVTWAVQTTQARASVLGVPVTAQACFADPYDLDFESAASRLGNSWIDSGINALSILWRFMKPAGRTSLRRIGESSHSVFEAHIAFRADDRDLDALVLTTWQVTDPAKTTRIRYGSGAELVMDHTAVAGHLVVDGKIAEVFGADASVSRRERHYRALYQSWLGDNRPIATLQDHLLLHDLLLKPSDGAHV